MMVKVCGITTLEDAQMCAQAGASAIGFNFYPRSPRFITPEAAARIVRAMEPGVVTAGIFVDETAEQMERTIAAVGLHVAQIYGDAIPAGVRAWRACRITEFRPEMAEGVEAVLVDTPSTQALGGTGETFDWSLARGLARKVILAGGLDGGNVREAILQAQPWGVDACSRLETSPGRKDPAKVQSFVKAAFCL